MYAGAAMFRSESWNIDLGSGEALDKKKKEKTLVLADVTCSNADEGKKKGEEYYSAWDYRQRHME